MALIILFFVSLLFGQLGAISPVPGVYIYLHDVTLGILVLFSFLRLRDLRFKIYDLRLFWPIIAFLAASILSVVLNANRLDQPALIRSLLYIGRWGYYALLYFIVAGSKRPAFWLLGLYFTGVGFAIIGMIQFFLYPSLRNLLYLGWDPHYYRVFSTLLDPNFTGIMLVLTLFLGMSVKSQLKSSRIANILSGIVGIAFVLTFSRSSMLALLAGLAVWIVSRRKWNIVWIAAVLLGVFIAMPKPGGDTLRIFRPESTMARIGGWQESVQLIASSPVVGHGFYALRQGSGQALDFTLTRANAYLDNSLLFVFATTGIIGLASYLWLLRSIERGMERVSEKPLKHLRVVGLMSLAGLIVHSMFVNSLFYAWVMQWVWILAGISESISDT